MRGLHREWAAALVVLVVAACGGGSADSTAPTTQEATATTEERTTTTEKTATVEQVAGVVAQHDRELLDAMEEATACTVVLFPEDCDLSGRLTMVSLGFMAGTLEVELDAFDDDKPRNQLYVGAYPEEVRPLVEETLEAAREVQAATEEWQDACGEDVTTEECTAAGRATTQAFASLERALKRWRPYL